MFDLRTEYLDSTGTYRAVWSGAGTFVNYCRNKIAIDDVSTKNVI